MKNNEENVGSGGGTFLLFRRFGFMLFAVSLFSSSSFDFSYILSVRCKRLSLPYTTSLAMVFSFAATTFREVGVFDEELKLNRKTIQG